MRPTSVFLAALMGLAVSISACHPIDTNDTNSNSSSQSEARQLLKYHLQNKEFPQAKNILVGFVAAGTAQPEEYAQLSELYLASGEVDKGEMVLRDGLKRFENNSYLTMRLGVYIAALKRYSEALPLLQKAHELAPKDPTTLNNLSNLQERLGDTAAASASAGQLYALAHGPGEGILYASKLEADHKPEEAERVYREVVAMAPENVLALNNLAALLQDKGKLNEAEGLARHATQNVPDNSHLLDTLGWILVKEKNYQEGEQILQRSVSLDPNVGVFHYHSGVTETYLGKPTEARKELAEALRLEPSAIWAQDAQNHLSQLH
jgi:tetratricopeptide (TPR) repeat protein